MKYEELVKALRIVEKEQDCNECEAGRWHHDFNCCLFADAAAAIEELDAEETRLLLITSELQDKVLELAKRNEELQAEVDKWQDVAYQDSLEQMKMRERIWELEALKWEDKLVVQE